MERDDYTYFSSRRMHPDPIDLCPLCGAYLGNSMFLHIREIHRVNFQFSSLSRDAGRLYMCLCGEYYAIYRHLREHFRDHGVNCYHIYLLTGGDNVRDSG